MRSRAGDERAPFRIRLGPLEAFPIEGTGQGLHPHWRPAIDQAAGEGLVPAPGHLLPEEDFNVILADVLQIQHRVDPERIARRVYEGLERLLLLSLGRNDQPKEVSHQRCTPHLL
jgi:hypothetical protein